MTRLVFSVSLLLSASLLSAAEIPVGSPTSDRLFIVARELYGRGILDRLEYSSIGEVSDRKLGTFESQLKGLFNELADGFNHKGQTPCLRTSLDVIESNRQRISNANYVKLFPQVKIAFNPRLSATLSYRVDGELDNDPRYDGKSWNGIAGFAENATIDYESDDFELRAGVERISWGFGRFGNLMFARQALPMTMIGFGYHRWIIDFESIVGFLSPIKGELDRMEGDTSFFTSQQRYLSAHSLSLRPLPGLSVSLREAVVYGGPGRRFEPAYAFPILWYHEQQLNSRLDDNILASVGVDYRLRGKLWVYGELLVDDFQVERKSRGDYEPNEMAYLAGGEFYDLIFRGSTVALEYARVNNWTYNQGRAHNRFMNQNYPLGFPTGPDAVVLDWQLALWAAADVKLAYAGSVTRHGAGRIDAPWTNPWLEVDHYSEPFPTGIVERTTRNGLSLLAFRKNWLWGNLEVNFADIANAGNLPGRNKKSWDFAIDVGCRLPPFSRGF
jgi:hypothetical protein